MDLDKRQRRDDANTQKNRKSLDPTDAAAEETGPSHEPLSLPAPTPAIPPEVMELIRRVVRYMAKYYEGLHIHDGEHDLAVGFAQQSPDGMTEDELDKIVARIEQNPLWEELLRELGDAADREVDIKYPRRRHPYR